MLVRPVCVVGLGLIGGSILRACVASGRTVWGMTASIEDAERARIEGYEVESTIGAALRRAAEVDALVVLAVPLPALAEALAAVAEFAPECRLTDVMSVKAPVLAQVRRFVPQAHYVGGHPMAGRAESGWAAGSATLFDGAAWVVSVDDYLTEQPNGLAVWRDVVALALDCGAHVVPATARDHDDAVARVSNLPHLLAAVLASVGAHGGPLALSLAAGSFGDGTRVAASRPELVRAMCEANKTALLEALDDALGQLGVARGALASTGALAATINTGHRARNALDELRAAPHVRQRIELAMPDAFALLRDLGIRGGRVTELAENAVLAELSPEKETLIS